jgi:hypothetical protein
MKLVNYILIFSSISVFSQNDLKKKPLTGAGLNVPMSLPSTPVKPSIFTLSTPSLSSPLPQISAPKIPSIIEKKSQIDLSNQPVFANPDQDLLDRLNKKNAPVTENFELIRGNQDFGSFSSKTNLVNIKCRDFGEVDDDEVRIYLNGKLVESRVILDSYFKDIEIPLEKGFNKIEIEAINQGTTGPNTAEFKIFDDSGKLIVSNQWNLATGFKAVIVFTKE